MEIIQNEKFKKDAIDYENERHILINSGAKNQVKNIKNRAILLYDKDDHQIYERLQKLLKNHCIIHIKQKETWEYFKKSGVPIVYVDKKDTEDVILQKVRLYNEYVDSRHQSLEILYIEYTWKLNRIHFFNDIMLKKYRKLQFIGIKDVFAKKPILVFSDNQVERKKDDEYTHFIFYGAIGDTMIILPIFYFLIEKYKHENQKLNFILHYTINYDFIKYFLNDFESTVIYEKPFNFKTTTEFALKEYQNFKLVDTIKICAKLFGNKEYKSFFELLCEESNFEITITPNTLLKKFKQHLHIKVSEKLNKIKNNHKKVICFQRMSGTRDMMTSEIAKQIPINIAKHIIDYCIKMDYAVINIEPAETNKDLFMYDLSNNSLPEIVEILNGADLFIGVDSCFGHICALIDTPNIICHGSTCPWYKYFSPAFMPLSHSYSFLPKDMNYNNLDPDRINTVLNEVLSGKRYFCTDFTPFEQREEYIHFEQC